MYRIKVLRNLSSNEALNCNIELVVFPCSVGAQVSGTLSSGLSLSYMVLGTSYLSLELSVGAHPIIWVSPVLQEMLKERCKAGKAGRPLNQVQA